MTELVVGEAVVSGFCILVDVSEIRIESLDFVTQANRCEISGTVEAVAWE